MKRIAFFLLLSFQLSAQPFTAKEVSRWERQAQRVNIIRDQWGIPHIYGKTDADAVFGLLYAQCEDDFPRVEMNYIEKLGRRSEVYGDNSIYNDLYIRMIIDSAEAVADYKKAPLWLKQLLNAYADGINFYLYKHPDVSPQLLHRFEPWYPLLWTDGSIGAISTGDVTVNDVKALFTNDTAAQYHAFFSEREEPLSTGSNGFAVGPSRTASGHAILYINPHVTFYFRPEVHMVSEQGLNAYGAVTWGQPFVYQGFNEYCGWMHTSSNVDVADMYGENIVEKKNGTFYGYDGGYLPVKRKQIKIKVLRTTGTIERSFDVMYTHHGPVMAKWNGQYISVRSNNRNINGIIQSWQRTKAKGLEDYKKVMALRANTSNNTVFADDKGHIAYWHGNFVPVRDPKYKWGKVVDGTTKATEWKGLHTVDETVHVYDPATGWIQNCNSTPYTVSGSSSPEKKRYPNYMAPDGENFRGINAARVLDKEHRFTIDKLIAAGYDRHLSAFDVLLPALVRSFNSLLPTDSLYALLQQPVAVLNAWDHEASDTSVATTLAIEWAEKVGRTISKIYVDDDELDQVQSTRVFADTASATTLLLPLLQEVRTLQQRHGTWQVAWGTINRYQRLNASLNNQYDDAKASVPVPFASALWGMLPSYNSAYFPGTNKRYGIHGNSFICAVEFGKRIKARSLLAGGESGDPASPHFADQLLMYTKGQFKEVNFYKEDVLRHAERQYHPGQ